MRIGATLLPRIVTEQTRRAPESLDLVDLDDGLVAVAAAAANEEAGDHHDADGDCCDHCGVFDGLCRRIDGSGEFLRFAL